MSYLQAVTEAPRNFQFFFIRPGARAFIIWRKAQKGTDPRKRLIFPFDKSGQNKITLVNILGNKYMLW